MNKLEGMPRPNVINLYEAPERMEYTTQEFAKLGISDINFIRFTRWKDGEGDWEIWYPNPGVEKGVAKGTFSSHLLAIKWWYENTNEEVGIFFEDDVDFTPVQHWNFTYQEFINRLGNKWLALHLCGIYDQPWNMWKDYPIMAPRRREYYDHGLQCYVLKRKYAEKLVRFYFDHELGENVIKWHMPLPFNHTSTENNVLTGFGRCYSFPLFNHNVNDFDTTNIYGIKVELMANSDEYREQANASIYSYQLIDRWWKETGTHLTLDEIFNYDRQESKKFMEIEL